MNGENERQSRAMIKFVENPPQDVKYIPAEDDIGSKLSPADVDQIAEIFKTPLTGAYTWNYAESDKKLRKLYRLGKERNWNADIDIDWSRTYSRLKSPMIEGGENPYESWAPFEALTEAEQIEFGWHQHAWTMSQFLHGEQGALLVSSQLVQLRADLRRQAVRVVADVRRGAPRRGVRPLSQRQGRHHVPGQSPT